MSRYKRKLKPYDPKIRYSCLTGRAVWLWQAKTRSGLWKAYQRARRHEFDRIRGWVHVVAQRRQNILRFLSDLTSALPIFGDINKMQRKAAQRIRRIANEEPELDRDFYEHTIREKERRRKQRYVRRKKKHEKEESRKNSQNNDN